MRMTQAGYDYNCAVYYRARYYDPTIGRFISEDPIQFGGSGTNFYAYVGNRPTSLKDPYGLCPTCTNVLLDSLKDTFMELGEKVGLPDLYENIDKAINASKAVSSSLNSLAQSVRNVPASAWASAGAGSAIVANLLKASGAAQTLGAAIEESMNPLVGTIVLGVFDAALANAGWEEAQEALNGKCTAN